MQPTKTKKKLPYLTEEDLNAPIKAVKVKVYGSYTKRGEQRKEVYEDHYEEELEVPEKFNMGHVKLAANRCVKNKLHGIRARTYNLDRDFPAVPVTEKRKVRDFISAQGLIDNDSLKREHERKLEQARLDREAREGPDYVPPAFSDDTQYGADGLPKLRHIDIPGGGQE